MALELIERRPSDDDTPICACAWNQKTAGLLITGDLYGKVKTWDFNREGNCCETLMTTRSVDGYNSILSVAIHPDGDIVAVSSSNGSVRVFRLSNTEKKFSIFRKPSKDAIPRECAVRQLKFSPKGTHLAGAGGMSASLKLWNDNDNVWKNSKWKNHQDLPVPSDDDPPNRNISKGINKKFVTSVAWNPSGSQVACGSMGGSICVFNVPGNQVFHVFKCTTISVLSLAYSPLANNILVSGSDDDCIHVHDLDQKKVISIMQGHSDWVLSVDVSPDGKTIASGSVDGTVKLWDIETGAPITTMAVHSCRVKGVEFIAMEGGESRLASVSYDASVSLYKYCSS